MIKVVLSNQILKYITEIERNRYVASSISLPYSVASKLRKNSKKKSSYASNKIEGNPLSEQQANEVIDNDASRHLLKPEQEIRNYYLALSFLEQQIKENSPFSLDLILSTQKLVEKGAPKEKIGVRGPIPAGVLFAVYDSETGNPDYIPPEHCDIKPLLEELINYVNTTDDHPLIIAAVVHYQLVTIHPFEDGNGRTARLMSGYILDKYGFGFNGIGSLEEYFAYDIDEYYESIQMGLPPLYYSGRDNPPNPEKWVLYFLRMVSLYSSKTIELQKSKNDDSVSNSLSHLKQREKDMLSFLLTNYKNDFTPIEVSKKLSITNKTVINRLSALVKTGFVEPVIIMERIRNYKLSETSINNKKAILKQVKQ